MTDTKTADFLEVASPLTPGLVAPARDYRKELFVGVVTGLIGDSGKTPPLGEILDAGQAAVMRFDEIFGKSP